MTVTIKHDSYCIVLNLLLMAHVRFCHLLNSNTFSPNSVESKQTVVEKTFDSERICRISNENAFCYLTNYIIAQFEMRIGNSIELVEITKNKNEKNFTDSLHTDTYVSLKSKRLWLM